MAAYFIVDVNVTDPEGFTEYKELSGPTVERYGGKYIVRGGASETVEGKWQPHRLVIVEFESMEQARRWYNSEEYTAAKNIRFKTATSEGIFIEGL